jgi:hypothetical protein
MGNVSYLEKETLNHKKERRKKRKKSPGLVFFHAYNHIPLILERCPKT